MKLKSCLAAVLAAVLALPQVSSPVVAQTTTATLLPPGKQCFQATTGVNGMVGTIGTITGGSAYVAGTYGGVALTGGSGSTATANITIAGGAVTAVTILNPGVQYVVGDVLSAAAASIGGAGSGFSFPVASTSINSSLAGGSVAYYVPSTLTTKQTWQNSGETVLNVQPVPLDANGCAIVYGSGIYRQILKDSLGNTVWDALTSSTGSGSGGGGGTITSDNNFVGTVLPWNGTVAPNNYMFAFGQTISRTTYATLLSVLSFQQINAVCTSGSTTLSGLSDTTQIPIGATIEGACIAPATTVVSKAAGSVVMSAGATISTSITVTFFPFGDGDGATTFNLPDYRGRAPVGRNNMGGSPASTLTSTYYGTIPDALGASGGAQSSTLTTPNLPPYTPAGTVSVTNQSTTSPGTAGGILATSNNGPTGSTTISATFTGTPAPGQVSTPFSNVQPSITVNYIIKVTVGTSSTSIIVVPSGGTSVPLFSTGVVGAPPVYRAITGADLPNPSTTTLGGVFSKPLTTGQVLGGIDNSGTPQVAPSAIFTSGATAFALAAGRQGGTQPAFQVDASNAASITGIAIAAQASGNGVNISAIGETNVPLIINGAGSGTINFGTNSTGSVISFRNIAVNHDSNPTLTLGSAGGSLAHVTMPGSSGVAVTTGGGDQVKVLDTASATRRITMTGSNGGNPTLSTDGGSLGMGVAVVGAAAVDGTMAATTIKCNTTGGVAISTDCTAAQVRTLTEQSGTLLAVLTASNSANLSDTTHFTAAYDDYMITFNNLVPVTNTVGFNCVVHSGGSFPATSYINGAGGSTTFIDVTSGGATVVNTAGLGVNGTMYLRNVNSTSVNKFMDGRTYTATAGPAILAHNPAGYWGGGQGAVDGIQCQFTSGNASTGNIKIIGLRPAL